MAGVGAGAILVRLKLPLPAVYRSLVAPRRILELYQAVGAWAGRVFEVCARGIPYLQRKASGMCASVLCSCCKADGIRPRTGKGVGRILFSTIIPLGALLPTPSSTLPVSLERHSLKR